MKNMRRKKRETWIIRKTEAKKTSTKSILWKRLYIPPWSPRNAGDCINVVSSISFEAGYTDSRREILYGKQPTMMNIWKYTYTFRSVTDPDPGSGAFLTPGSHIFESLVAIFWVKSSIVLWKLVQIFFFNISNKIILFCEIYGSKIRDPGWVKIRIRDKHPGSATLPSGALQMWRTTCLLVQKSQLNRSLSLAESASVSPAAASPLVRVR
jgi:hypothetical protein